MNIFRCRENLQAVSSLNLMEDALDAIRFLCSEDFVIEQLRSTHSKTPAEARGLGRQVIAHARVALDYANQSLDSPPQIAALSGYYAALNLAKVVILFGPFSSQLSNHARWHGATYNALGKSSQSLLTEEVKVRGGGALALFYKTLTGKAIPQDRVFKLRDVYQLTPGISHEVNLATNSKSRLVSLRFSAKKQGSNAVILAKAISAEERKEYEGTVRRLPVLCANFRKVRNQKGLFQCKVALPAGAKLFDVARSLVSTEYLLMSPIDRNPGNEVLTLQQSSGFPLPEEFATALVFFHLSSLCRYNPEQLEKIQQSRFWPVVLAARRHSLYDFLVKAWSYVLQKNVHFVSY